MKLLSLKLKNFKGCRSFELQPNGENVNIFGDNATYKTTQFDAFLWLLYGKDSQNKADFDIKTLDKNNQPLHGLEHEVDATFEVSGRPLSLKKVFAEKWTKKRGSATNEFTGHSTDYFVNGVPVKESEYKTKIAEIASETTFKLLTSPTYFNVNLSWQDRRKTLLQVCGDIQDEDVIASNPALSRLPEILQGRSIEDHRKIIAGRRAKINDELQKIPIRISEVENSTPEVANLSKEELSAEIERFQAVVNEKNRQLTDLDNGGVVSEKRREIQEVETEILRIKNEQQEKADCQTRSLREQLDGFRSQWSIVKNDISFEKRDLERHNTNLFAFESALKGLRESWRAIKAREFSLSQDETCPTCGQPIPAEELESARQKALESFNLKNSTDLERNTAEGKKTSQESEELRAKIKVSEERISGLEKQDSDCQREIMRIQSEINEIKKVDLLKLDRPNPELELASVRKESIINEIAALQKNTFEAAEKIRQEIRSANNAINLMRVDYAKFDQRDKALARVDELKLQERDLAREYEKLEGELYLTEEFIRAKVSFLEEKINSRFKMARFKMFAEQINGGLQEVCETLYEGVPYGSLNSAGRIQVGIDIISTLSAFYEIEAPIFIDNRESVVKLPEINCQIISLIVSEKDKTLRVEIVNKSSMAA